MALSNKKIHIYSVPHSSASILHVAINSECIYILYICIKCVFFSVVFNSHSQCSIKIERKNWTVYVRKNVIYVTEPKYVISLHFINHATTRMDEYVLHKVYMCSVVYIYPVDYECNDVCNKHTIQIYFIPSITKLAVLHFGWCEIVYRIHWRMDGRLTDRPSNRWLVGWLIVSI